jgi:hypothetical protein
MATSPAPTPVPSVPDNRRFTKRDFLSPYKSGLPTVFHRIARRGVNWELPRNFRKYKASAEHEMSIGGAATKCFLSIGGAREGAYIAKFAHKNGEIETYTELLNNQFGKALGFEMAHSGVATLDGVLHFLSRSFLKPGEQLIHGSLMVEQLGLAKRDEIEKIKTVHQQQGTYDIDFVAMVIREFCGSAYESVFSKFIEMLVFDALIGSMDRHPRNWGVIRTATKSVSFSFAPIYDSARALLWDVNDDKIRSFLENESEMERYIGRSSPRIGLPAFVQGDRRCNHFQLLEYLCDNNKDLVFNAIDMISPSVVGVIRGLLYTWPFKNIFKIPRKQAIIKLIEIRYGRLKAIAAKGGE